MFAGRSAWVAGVVGGAATIALAGAALQAERSLIQADFRRQATGHATALQRRADRAVEVLSSVEGLWNASVDVDRAEFAAFTEPLLGPHPELQALEGLPKVTDAAALLAREPGVAELWRLEQGARVTATPTPERPIYPVWYAEPAIANYAAVGYDVSSEPTRRAALTEAIRSGEPSTSRPVDLVQDPSRQSVLIFQPIYQKAAGALPAAERAEALAGFALAVLDLQTLVDHAEDSSHDGSLDVTLVARASGPRVVVAHAGLGQVLDDPLLAYTSALSLPGLELPVEYRATAEFVRSHSYPFTIAAVLTGLVLTGLVAWQLRRDEASSRQQEALTRELRQANTALERQVEDRRRAEEAVQRFNRELGERVAARTAELERQGGELVEANQRLEQTEARLRLLLDQVAGAVWTVDRAMRVRFATGACVGDLLVPTDGELPLADAVRTDALRNPVLAAHLDALGGRTGTRDLVVNERIFELQVRPSGPELGGLLVALALDVTERRRLESERLEARHQAHRRLESLGMLAGGIAHDFNNLLTAILGNATLAMEQLEDEPHALRYLERIEIAAQRAGELTRGLLAYAGSGPEPLAPVDVGAIARELPGLSKRPEAVEVTLPADLPPVQGDAAQLGPLLLNLVQNGVEALRSPEGRVRVNVAPVTLSRPDELPGWATPPPPPGAYIRVSVQDDGVGMDDRTRERIFDPFFSTKPDNHGIGLAAALGMLRRHEGAIRVESTPGVGTRMEVMLVPVAPSAAPEPTPAPTPTSRSATVLAVDDEEAIRELVVTVLRHAGFDVVAASDGVEAVEAIQTEPDRFDLIVLDVMMPRLNGLEALAEIRRTHPTLPVVLSSGYAGTGLSDRVTRDPHLRQLPKPYRARELLRIVREALDQGEQKA